MVEPYFHFLGCTDVVRPPRCDGDGQIAISVIEPVAGPKRPQHPPCRIGVVIDLYLAMMLSVVIRGYPDPTEILDAGERE